jgi:hypothetical protein
LNKNVKSCVVCISYFSWVTKYLIPSSWK